MPNTTNVANLIKETATNSGEYLLILTDKVSGESTYGLVPSGEFRPTQLDGVFLMFDQSMQTLRNPAVVYYTPEELPILQQIGLFEVTIVERGESNVSVRDGSGGPVEAHIAAGE